MYFRKLLPRRHSAAYSMHRMPARMGMWHWDCVAELSAVCGWHVLQRRCGGAHAMLLLDCGLLLSRGQRGRRIMRAVPCRFSLRRQRHHMALQLWRRLLVCAGNWLGIAARIVFARELLRSRLRVPGHVPEGHVLYRRLRQRGVRRVYVPARICLRRREQQWAGVSLCCWALLQRWYRGTCRMRVRCGLRVRCEILGGSVR